MKIKFFSLFLVLLVTGLTSCTKDDDFNVAIEPLPKQIIGKGIKIMPLGDSRVQGLRPTFESYRYELWKNLVLNNWEFDFSGPVIDRSIYPEFMGKEFDTNHAGVAGFKTQDILAALHLVIKDVGVPDVVLLGAGTNDLLKNTSAKEALKNTHQIIDILQRYNKNIIILVEQIAPARSDYMSIKNTFDYRIYNSGIKKIERLQTTSKSKVIAVDMTKGWTDDYLADILHYNEKGAKFIADQYFKAMNQVLKRN